ncbi:MAG: glycerol-3-phosphate responsive antiterminator [Bacillota bacterium]
MLQNQKIIPAISNHQDLKLFLTLPLTYGILMNFQLAQLPELVKMMKDHNKKVLVHSELIKGLSSDEFGAIYLIQTLAVDGIISSKPKVIEVCKKRKIIGIFRFFLKDSVSLNQSLEIAKKITPSYLEVLPASCLDIIPRIKQETSSEILLGGLIQNRDQIEKCLLAGAIAVTTSNTKLWI